MTPSLGVVVAVLVAVLVLGSIVGWALNSRSGRIRDTATESSEVDTSDLGLSRTGPTVVHFSAVWCGPCAGVRRVVNQVCTQLGDVAHVEIDMDANPAAARRLSVLSLPTTFIFDAEGKQRYRTSGVPSANDLRSTLSSLLA